MKDEFETRRQIEQDFIERRISASEFRNKCRQEFGATRFNEQCVDAVIRDWED